MLIDPATRKWVVDMSEAWPCISGLCADDLQDSESKFLPTRSRLNAKTAMPRWRRSLWNRSSFTGLRADMKTAGLEVVSLDTLLPQTQESFKRALEPHARMRLQGALKRWSQVFASIQGAVSAVHVSHHVLRPEWQPGKIRCVQCSSAYDLSVSPVCWRKKC